tara:strand:- start:2163 stop:2615 length:453 start_codon:yes stop_codon:yes gene_type:complete
MAKKMSLNAWINSKLKDKGLTVKQAKKNAGKYKSISAAKKAGSLYYTNKDGKIMIAAYAEDLKMPLKRPKSIEKKKLDFNKIEKKRLDPHPSTPPKGPNLKQRVESKPPIRLHVKTLERQRERKAWEKKFGEFYNSNGLLKKKYGGKHDK